VQPERAASPEYHAPHSITAGPSRRHRRAQRDDLALL
jgi:hypothetical protein